MDRWIDFFKEKKKKTKKRKETKKEKPENISLHHKVCSPSSRESQRLCQKNTHWTVPEILALMTRCR